MPYVSKQQQKFFHTEAGIKALGGKEKVKEWDKKSIGKKLPKNAFSKIKNWMK